MLILGAVLSAFGTLGSAMGDSTWLAVSLLLGMTLLAAGVHWIGRAGPSS
jgi:hypothetical protein